MEYRLAPISIRIQGFNVPNVMLFLLPKPLASAVEKD
jgi:hypothetical protein